MPIHVPVINELMNDIAQKLAVRSLARIIIGVIKVFWTRQLGKYSVGFGELLEKVLGGISGTKETFRSRAPSSSFSGIC